MERDRLHTSAGAALTLLTREVLLTNGVLIAAGDALASDLGLSSARWQVMGAIRTAPKPVAQIARERGLTRQSVQRVVNELRRQQFVRLIDNPKHRRAKLVQLTPKGAATLTTLRKRQARLMNGSGRAFTIRELTRGCELLRRLRAAWGVPDARRTRSGRARLGSRAPGAIL